MQRLPKSLILLVVILGILCTQMAVALTGPPLHKEAAVAKNPATKQTPPTPESTKLAAEMSPVPAEPTIVSAKSITIRPTMVQPITAQPTTARTSTTRPSTVQPTTARPYTTRPTTARPTTAQPSTTWPTTTQSTTAPPTSVPTQPTTVAAAPAKPSQKFHLSPTKANWFGANMYCQRNSSKLVVLDSADMQQELEEFIDSHNLRKLPFWTAGNQLMDMKTWRWGIDGPLIDYTHWSIGQPDNYRNSQHCLKLFPESLHWDDDNCERVYDFICLK